MIPNKKVERGLNVVKQNEIQLDKNSSKNVPNKPQNENTSIVNNDK